MRHNSFLRVLYSRAKGLVARAFSPNRSKKMVIIGITWTDGKTSTSYFTAQLLQKSWYTVWLACGQEYRIWDKKEKNLTKRTTPSPFFVWNFLWRCYRAWCTHVVLETSSHALIQRRVFGVFYDICAITNLTQEHGDYHPTMKEYAQAKAQLFKKLQHTSAWFWQKLCIHKPSKPVAIIPSGIPYQDIFTKNSPDTIINFDIWKDKTIDIQKQPSNHSLQTHTRYHAHILSQDQSSSQIEFFVSKKESYTWNIPLPWSYNVSNMIIAWIICHSCSISRSSLAWYITKVAPVAWRMQHVAIAKDINVFVDFAVTPWALSSVLLFARTVTKNKVWLVFWCTWWQHDHIKRPLMWTVAVQWADHVVITEDESYGESINDIYQDIVRDIPAESMQNIYFEPKRKDAIWYALEQATSWDVVLVTWMGDLESRNDGTKEIARSDIDVIKQYSTN